MQVKEVTVKTEMGSLASSRPAISEDIPIPNEIGSIVIFMLMIVFTRLILGQPPTPRQ